MEKLLKAIKFKNTPSSKLCLVTYGTNHILKVNFPILEKITINFPDPISKSSTVFITNIVIFILKQFKSSEINITMRLLKNLKPVSTTLHFNDF